MRKRTLAREIALQAIYQHDLQRRHAATRPGAASPPPHTPQDFDELIAERSEDPEVRAYARALVDGAMARADEIDRRISEAALHWKLHRIAPVDRSVLRLAIFELLERPDVPPKVVINEAVDLAKKFSTEGSGAFVNGILDRIYGELARR